MSKIDVVFDYICQAAERSTGFTDAEKRELRGALVDELHSSIEDAQLDKDDLDPMKRTGQ